MNHATKIDGRLPQKGPETGLPAVVYRLEKQNMTVTLFSRAESEPVIELALGTEARSFPLSEFIHFWLTIVEVGFKRDIAKLESGEVFRRIRRKR
jgi:hypothetical protein